ncbi:MAG: SDR family NAD(P)-dependent oxidoreductase, partial [Actinomycetota bacterium]
MTRDLEGRVALVTGGGRGIGREITLHLAARGANVVVCYLRKRQDAEETCRIAESHAVKATALRANVGDPAHIDGLFDEIDEMYGRLDVLVSNAA